MGIVTFSLTLIQVFKDKEWPPEVQFGSFAAIIGPMGSPWEGDALLRVDIGAARGRVSAKNLQILLILSTQDLYRLVVSYVKNVFILLILSS